MHVKQISAFVENKPGRLAKIVRYLSDENINILAISMADTADFGIIRFIVEDTEKAYETLKKHDIVAKVTDVLAIAMGNTPGSLADILDELKKLNISIEYMYAFTIKSSMYDSMVILRVSNQQEVLEAIKDNEKIRLLKIEEISQ